MTDVEGDSEYYPRIIKDMYLLVRTSYFIG